MTADGRSRKEVLAAYDKAAEEAAEAREKNRARRMRIRESREEEALVKRQMISDLKRVYDHPDNPYAGSTASRQRYRKLGKFPEMFVTDLFGNHQQFLRAAGFLDSRTTQKVRNQTARLETARKVRDYAEKHVLRSVGRWDKKLRDKTGERVVLVGSDFHSQFLDPLAWEVFCDVAKDTEPDLIVLNGDVADFPNVSRYTNRPGAAALTLQNEIDFVRDHILRPLREDHPNTPITWHIGNHEFRLVNYLADAAPAMASLRCLAFDELFGIDEFEIEMVFGGSFLAPAKKQEDEAIRKSFRTYYDCFSVSHGVSIGKDAARVELGRFGRSGTSGHTHRPMTVWHPTDICPTASWTSTGMMAGFAVGKEYVDGPSAWTMGFGVFTIDPGSSTVIPHPVTIHEHFAEFGGKVWRPTPECERIRRQMWGENGDVTGHDRLGLVSA